MRASSYRDLVARMQERVGTELPRPAAARPEPLGAETRVPLYLYEMR
jgi:hypothetical protein